MGKEYGGIPLWMWLAGGGVVVLGYLYIRSHSAASSKSTGSGGGGGGAGGGGGKYASTTHTTLRETITDLQSHPKPKAKKPPRVNPGGPDRRR
jgi:hypothetical protein